MLTINQSRPVPGFSHGQKVMTRVKSPVQSGEYASVLGIGGVGW